MISSKKYVDETLRRYNLVANKSLGQNFLVEESIVLDIINSIIISEKMAIIEVGPGLGALTEHLVKIAPTFAYEIDQNMINILKETICNENLHLIHHDFSKVNIEDIINNLLSCGFKNIVFISNLPYYLTSKIINIIMTSSMKISQIIVMMQKEVGLKLLRPEKKQINQLTSIIEYKYESSIVKYVSKNSYLPRPEIDSIVLSFALKPIDDKLFKNFLDVTSAIFNARRKTIANNLKVFFKTADELNVFLESIEIDPSLRCEQLNLNNILLIASKIK